MTLCSLGFGDREGDDAPAVAEVGGLEMVDPFVAFIQRGECRGTDLVADTTANGCGFEPTLSF